jgi:hemerythrin-like domain-containing protein
MATTLLNDDGTASMATALMMSHHGLRRDIARFALALGPVADGDLSRVAALRDEWQGYRNTLHGHHEAEDARMFPSMRSEHAGLAAVIDQLSADHRRIDPLLEEGDRVFARLPASVGAAAAVVSQLSALLDPHLATEETHIIPLIRAAKGFPPPANDAEAEMYAQGFAWASHGVAPEVLAQVDAMLPESVRARLPAARAAFEARCERVWGPSKPGASRTSIPDWLPGG